MNLIFKIKNGFLLLAGLLLPLFAAAQVEMPASVLGNGGAPVSDGTLRLNGTLAQSAIGVVDGTANKEKIGFWYQARNLLTGIELIDPNVDAHVFRLDQNFPNPADGTTTIPFAVPHTAKVRLLVISSEGRVAGLLVDEELIPGVYQAGMDVSKLAPGIYFYQLFADGILQGSRKMIVN